MFLIAVVLGSALLHAGWNALLRGHPDRRPGAVAVLTVCGASAIVAAVIELAITGAPPFPQLRGLVASVAAGVLEAAYFVSLRRGLTAGELGPVYTISRGGAV